jgi:hypothetical protein
MPNNCEMIGKGNVDDFNPWWLHFLTEGFGGRKWCK